MTTPLSFVPEAFVTGPSAPALCAADHAFALAGGPMAFAAARVDGRSVPAGRLRRMAGDMAADGERALAERLERITAPRGDFAGLAVSGPGARPRIMGVCNVTPDSFSDGGDHAVAQAAIAFARAMAAAGADIIDVGGESTRPGAAEVSVDEECARVLPVVSALAGEGLCVSIDTRKTAVMRAALDAGAAIINDVSGLSDAGALDLAAAAGVPVILMHMRGTPDTMQNDPSYADVVTDVYAYLAARAEACRSAGIAEANIALDPGFGFGKSVRHNQVLLQDLAAFHGIGCTLVVGLSRKSFIGAWTGADAPKDRVSGSVAAALAAVARGAQIVRVHDVEETRRAIDVWRRACGLAG